MTDFQTDLFGAPDVPIDTTPIPEPEPEPVEPEPEVPFDPDQTTLFDLRPPWEIEWVGMPEFIHEDLTPVRSLIVNFESDADVEKFSKLVEQSIGPALRSLWYPEAEIARHADKRYADKNS